MDQREAEAEAEGEEERIGDKADVLGEPQLGLGYVQVPTSAARRILTCGHLRGTPASDQFSFLFTAGNIIISDLLNIFSLCSSPFVFFLDFTIF